MKKKILSLILCVAVILSVSGIAYSKIGAQIEVESIYVSSAGNDNNDGLTASTALKTIAAAVNKVNDLGLEGEDRVINVIKSDWNDLSFNMLSCNPYNEMITLKADGLTVWTNSDMHLAGPLTLDMTYGYSKGQSGLKIYTHGFDFVLGKNALDNYNDTIICAGYDKNYDSIQKDSYGILDFGKDINVSLETEKTFNVSLYIGNYAYNDIGIVQYKDVNILIDSPNATVPLFNIGNNGNYNIGLADRMNRFENFSLTINSVAGISSITGSTYYNGSIINNLQYVYNNATFSKVTNNMTYGDYGEPSVTYINKWELKEENDTADAVICVTDNMGEFKTKGINVAVATDSNSNSYKSVNGRLNLAGDGEYTITYESAGDYHYADGVLTAVKDIDSIDLTDIAPVQENNKILKGWQNADGNYLSDTKNISLSANEKLYAVYTDFDVNNDENHADFYVSHAEYRSDSKVGLRFLINKGENFKFALEEFSDIKYGYLALPKHYIDLGETLTVDNDNAAKGVCDKGMLYFSADTKNYTVCITDIKENHYNEPFNACGYVTYTDLNGNIRTVYSNTISCSILETAADAVNSGNLTEEKKAEAEKFIKDGLSTAKTNLKNEIAGLEDTVGADAKGTVYYVSENGSDSNNGLSESTPWKTLKKVNETTFNPGDVVLFERGGTYRSYFKDSIRVWQEHSSVDLQSGVSYGAYGTGAKPIISGSNMNFAEKTWTSYSGKENVYYAKLQYYIDPGVLRVTTNQNYSYDGSVQATINDLDKDWEFCYDRNGTGYIYLYCPYGNPSNLLKDIEIGFGVSMFRIKEISNVIIENLDFRFIGRHAIASTEESTDIIIRGCDFSYIGGCLPSPTDDTTDASNERLGNAVEFLNGGRNVLVEKCNFDNIYDSGVTFQGGKTAYMLVDNFTVRDCVFNKCGLGSFEYWLGRPAVAKNILIENNYMENAGLGFGGVDLRLNGSKDRNGHIRADGTNRICNFVIRNNYMDSSANDAYLLVLAGLKLKGGSNPYFYNNTYVQSNDKKLMLIIDDIQNKPYAFDTDATDNLKNFVDSRPVVIYE